ncbi:hypothetical protein JKP88DRAFT_255786 [Tribonema minus]|uniref:Uncharacterized protein n=1 Tax=Tribonema minus TaxID=303371 RepID=A0A835YXZ0_9STRA|nr:hypothetical protein JKP88DRAFT_255786 [Tribonema minus]
MDRVCVQAKTAYQRCVRNTTSNIAAMLALLSQDGLLSEQALQTATDSLDKVLTVFLVPELQRLPHFQHTEVTLSPPGAGGIRTVRIRAIFNKNAHLDDVLRRLGIGCRLADIIPELSIDMALRCSLAGCELSWPSGHCSKAYGEPVVVHKTCEYVERLIGQDIRLRHRTITCSLEKALVFHRHGTRNIQDTMQKISAYVGKNCQNDDSAGGAAQQQRKLCAASSNAKSALLAAAEHLRCCLIRSAEKQRGHTDFGRSDAAHALECVIFYFKHVASAAGPVFLCSDHSTADGKQAQHHAHTLYAIKYKPQAGDDRYRTGARCRTIDRQILPPAASGARPRQQRSSLSTLTQLVRMHVAVLRCTSLKSAAASVHVPQRCSAASDFCSGSGGSDSRDLFAMLNGANCWRAANTLWCCCWCAHEPCFMGAGAGTAGQLVDGQELQKYRKAELKHGEDAGGEFPKTTRGVLKTVLRTYENEAGRLPPGQDVRLRHRIITCSLGKVLHRHGTQNIQDTMQKVSAYVGKWACRLAAIHHPLRSARWLLPLTRTAVCILFPELEEEVFEVFGALYRTWVLAILNEQKEAARRTVNDKYRVACTALAGEHTRTCDIEAGGQGLVMFNCDCSGATNIGMRGVCTVRGMEDIIPGGTLE